MLAKLAGDALVAAATADNWSALRDRIAAVVGGGDANRTRLAMHRLDQCRATLMAATPEALDQVRAIQVTVWTTRLTDLLEERPGSEAELRALADDIRAALPHGAITAAGHSVAAFGDVNISAAGGGIAAGVIHGSLEHPYLHGGSPPGIGPVGSLGPAAAVAGPSGTAIATLIQHRPEVTAVPVWLPPRPGPLAGREDLLAELHARLTDGMSSGPSIVALHGLGGVGKTSIAIEYAYRHQAEVTVSWQLPAEDQVVLASGFARLADQLGLRDMLDNRDPVASVHAALGTRPTGWLLIFDNAISYEAISRFLPPVGHGRILITTQNPNWLPGQAFEIQALPADVAARFLCMRTGDGDQATARILAGELGGLPLALEQAAAYVLTVGTSLARYLNLFHERRADLLDRGEPTGYRKTVATTWQVAFTQLDGVAPLAITLLRLLAFCAPEPVPVNLLLNPAQDIKSQLPGDLIPLIAPLIGDEVAINDAVAELRRYSLVTFAGVGLVLTHRLVQAVTKDQMPPRLASQWHEAAAVLVNAAIPADPESPATWPVFADVLPHAQAVLDTSSDGLFRITNYLAYTGDYSAAIRQFIAILSVIEQSLGTGHPHTLICRQYLATWTGEAGDPHSARDQYAALLPFQEQILGAQHPDTLNVRHNLARWTGQAGDPAAARDNITSLLPIYERVLGVEHPDTLTARSNLARWTAAAGDPGTARDQLAVLLPVRERVLGPEHPRTLNTRYELARWTGQAGDPGTACDQLAVLLPVRERVLGPEHPDTLNTRYEIARWTAAAGDPGTACDQLAALLPVRERMLGPNHPDTEATRRSLASWEHRA